MTKLITKGILTLIGIIAAITAVAFLTGHAQLLYREHFGVRQQNIETEIYRETEMYQEGKVQELAKAKLEYEQADSTGKNAVASMIRHRYADYDVDRLPEGLAEFLTQIRGY